MRRLLFNLHLYVALVAGLFVVILGLTGSVMAFEPELDHLFHAKLSYVKPGPRTLSLAEIGAVVAKMFPGERVLAYGIATSPGFSYQVQLQRGTVFVNEYTGEILGTIEKPDFISRFQNDAHQLHLRLLIQNKADSGKAIMSWAGAAVLFLLLSGIYLWWRLKRVTVAGGASSWRFWFDLHSAVGSFSLAFLLVLTLTGLMIGFDRQTTPLLYKITGSQSSPPPNFRLTPPPGAIPITPDQAADIARSTLPGAAPFLIIMPAASRPYIIPGRYPEDRTPGGRSIVFVDPYGGKVLYAQGSRTAPGGMRLVNLNRAIHTGDLFGIPSKIVMSLASLMAPLQLVSGVIMWWKRKRRSTAVSSDQPSR